MRNLFSGWPLAALGAVILMACGSSNNGPGPTPDGGSSDSGVLTDASAHDAGVAVSDAGPLGSDAGDSGDGGTASRAPDSGDGGEAGCNFATFVKGLISNDTTATALPSSNLGQGCQDDQNQAEFQPLFH
jgi:hypothetical protein